MELDLMSNYENVKNRVRSKLVSSDYHKNLETQGIVKRHITNDLYETWYVPMRTDGPYSANCIVTAPLLRAWGIDVDTLKCQADKNAEGTQQVTLLSEVLQYVVTDANTFDEPIPMYMISNKDSYNGSVAILNRFVQRRLDEIFGDTGCNILPSSVHELLAVPADSPLDELREMVRSINQSDVISDNDILSDHVYRYCKGELMLAV